MCTDALSLFSGWQNCLFLKVKINFTPSVEHSLMFFLVSRCRIEDFFPQHSAVIVYSFATTLTSFYCNYLLEPLCLPSPPHSVEIWKYKLYSLTNTGYRIVRNNYIRQRAFIESVSNFVGWELKNSAYCEEVGLLSMIIKYNRPRILLQAS